MSFVIAGNSASTGYNLTRSLRFRASASATLSRTPSVAATSNKTFTVSFWMKPSLLVPLSYIWILDCASQDFGFYLNASYTAGFQMSGGTNYITTSQVFRDPSAWYHMVIAVDTTQATAANRLKFYVNGSQVTAFSSASYPAQNTTFTWNQNGQVQYIGRNSSNSAWLYDGYFAEFYSIDGQQLTPSSFGSTNALTGVWQPAPYTGSYGTNGFVLDFEDNSALTTSSNVGLGKDTSGNGNYWTTNNISITAGVTYDSMTDVPTLTSATAANFAVLNPLKINATNPPTFSNGNLQTLTAATNFGITFGTIGVSTGKFYWEITPTSLTGGGSIGVAHDSAALDQFLGQNANGWSYYNDGNKYTNNTATAYGASYVANDVIGVALDMSAGTLVFYKNNSSQGTAFSGLTGTLFPAMSDGSGSGSATFAANFGQRPFTYTPPSGFVALNTYNLPTSTIVKGNTVMDATLYTGTGATQTITNAAGFKPDLLWVKARSRSSSHDLVDSVRGVNLALTSNSTQAEITGSFITSLNSNGFTLPANTLSDAYFTNVSGDTLVGWQWQAGQGSSASNTNGTITSTVSVNASAGFSVVTFAFPASGPWTTGHGLGVAPSFVIVKSRSNGTFGWFVYHVSAGPTGFLELQSTNAFATNSTTWNNTAPTSSVINFGTGFVSGNFGADGVAYCWTPIAGYSAFGSYTGNGSTDGPFVYTGFRPKWIMAKQSSAAGQSWNIFDTARNTYNLANTTLYADQSSAEDSVSNAYDILSNGFKLRTAASQGNTNGATYVYMAFAETPFKNSLAR
jgi:hypothetical protein